MSNDKKVFVPDEAKRRKYQDIIRENIHALPTERMKGIMRYLFSIDKQEPSKRSLKEVAKKFNITKERVRQVEEKAIRILEEKGILPANSEFTNSENGVESIEKVSKTYQNNILYILSVYIDAGDMEQLRRACHALSGQCSSRPPLCIRNLLTKKYRNMKEVMKILADEYVV